MKMRYPLVLALLGAIGIGAFGAKSGYAQAPSGAQPRALYIAEVEVTDPETLKVYSSRVTPTFEPFGGRYIVRGGTIAPLEGEAPKGRVVIIEFPSLEKAQAWYNSPEYLEVRPLRHKSARTRVFIVEATSPVK